MLTFNSLLTATGIDLASTKFVRHQDNRAGKGRSPYDLWRAADGRFDLFQRIQSRRAFDGAKWITSFVATPLGETLFAGIYEVGSVSAVASGTLYPLDDTLVSESEHLYELRLSPLLADYRGRVVIEWGPGYRTWAQRADRKEKPIVEIRRTVIDPPFPGFGAFMWRIRDLATVPVAWRQALTAVAGVYLLVCRSTGQRYVGSAYGTGGFWGRWEQYLATGHGGNVGMKTHGSDDFQVTILELASLSTTVDEVIALENRWKDKLLTRQFGLNLN